MTWNWLSFFLGIVCSFIISFGAIVGWWFLLIRHDPTETGKQIRDDFDKVRGAIRRANEAAQRN